MIEDFSNLSRRRIVFIVTLLLWFAGLWAAADADPIGMFLILLYGLFLLVREKRRRPVMISGAQTDAVG